MEQRHVDNISTLIHFMENLNDPRFDMGQFYHGCGTPSCALGWASTIKELQAQGVTTDLFIPGSWADPLAASDRAFGSSAYGALFNGSRNGHLRTTQQWADHARRYLAANGHAVTPKRDDQREEFRAFMERVVKPVTVTA